MQQKRHRCRLVLVTPPEIALETFADDFIAALSGGDVASVIVALDSEDDTVWRDACAALMDPAIRAGAAFLLRDRLSLVVEVNADGLHVEAGIPELPKLVKSLSPERIVGAGGATNRHDAMVSGESGVDYVMFGTTNPTPDRQMRYGDVKWLTEWWAELVTLPSIAPAASMEEARELVECGADFIAANELVWNHPEGAHTAVAALNTLFEQLAAQ